MWCHHIRAQLTNWINHSTYNTTKKDQTLEVSRVCVCVCVCACVCVVQTPKLPTQFRQTMQTSVCQWKSRDDLTHAWWAKVQGRLQPFTENHKPPPYKYTHTQAESRCGLDLSTRLQLTGATSLDNPRINITSLHHGPAQHTQKQEECSLLSRRGEALIVYGYVCTNVCTESMNESRL